MMQYSFSANGGTRTRTGCPRLLTPSSLEGTNLISLPQAKRWCLPLGVSGILGSLHGRRHTTASQAHASDTKAGYHHNSPKVICWVSAPSLELSWDLRWLSNYQCRSFARTRLSEILWLNTSCSEIALSICQLRGWNDIQAERFRK